MNNGEIRPPKMPPPWFVHTFWRAHRALHRLSGGGSCGPRRTSAAGVHSLVTTGRKSGQARTVIIGYLEDGPNSSRSR